MFLDNDSMSKKSLLVMLNFLTPEALDEEAEESILLKAGVLPGSVLNSSSVDALLSKSSKY
jgi:hypothetical protein